MKLEPQHFLHVMIYISNVGVLVTFSLDLDIEFELIFLAFHQAPRIGKFEM